MFEVDLLGDKLRHDFSSVFQPCHDLFVVVVVPIEMKFVVDKDVEVGVVEEEGQDLY
jgi:hypothetical protein